MKKYACLDIGGTAIKYGIIDGQGRILEKGSTATSAEHIVRTAVEIVERYRQSHNLLGICISTAGMVEPETGKIVYSGPTIPYYQGTCWKEIMESRFDLPCEAENDVNCANLAEFTSGASAGCDTAVMLTVGTGIGGSMILGGKLYHGCTNSAFEVGYMHMEGGDFQSLASAAALTKKVAERKREAVECWPGTRIFEEAKSGDSVCCQAIDEMADVLGKGIANICYTVNPQAVVLGGGIMAQEEFLKEKLEKSVRKYLLPILADNTRVLFAKHGNDAGMLGAYYHFCRRRSSEGEQNT